MSDNAMPEVTPETAPADVPQGAPAGANPPTNEAPSSVPVPAITVGIDFGSASTRIAMLDASKPMPTIIRNNLSNEATSTVVSLPSDDARCYGENAASREITKASETVVDLTQWLFGGTQMQRDDADLPPIPSFEKKIDEMAMMKEETQPLAKRWIGDRENYPVQVAAYFLKSILQFVPTDVSKLPVCLSIPSSASTHSIVALRQAALLAGIEKSNTTVTYSDEATAAYFHHLQYNDLDETTPTHVVIVDFGKSYCSASVLAVTKERLEKIAVESLNVGSGFIDAILCSYVYGEIEKKFPTRSLRGDVKTFRKILRECRKIKEILSTTEEARVQLESLPGDIDINVPITRAQTEGYSSALLRAFGEMLQRVMAKYPPREDGAEPRVEVVGGGWRSPFVTKIIKDVCGTSRVGVSLDANLAVAEGSAILAAVCTRRSDAAAADGAGSAEDPSWYPSHNVELVNFAVMDPSSPSVQPLTEQDEQAVTEWAVLEANMAAVDAAIHLRLAAVNQLDSYVLQTLDIVANCAAEEAQKEAAQSYLNSIDHYVREDCGGANADEITAKLQEVKAHVTKTFPEVEAYQEKVRQEERKKDEELTRLSQMHKDDEKELKTDPQRLRHAQRRREQGQALFKQECWSEAQTRFVQALAALGQIYDKENVEVKAQRQEIELSCYLNIASCSVKLGLWRNAMNNCARALEISPNNVKALFRRAEALLATKEYAEAVRDLERASELSNKDPAVVGKLQQAKHALQEQKAKEKRMFAKMFS